MGVPFCLYVLRTKPGLSALKFVSLLTLLAVPITVAGTGSRGGLVALGIMFMLYFIPLPPGQKLVSAMVAVMLAVVAITWSARSALDRYKTIFIDSSDVHLTESERSAMDSSGLRRELLFSSLQLTLRHPLMGVGPGMFAAANAGLVETKGLPSWNAWHETHNTFTQLSCEDGLPGLFLYCGTLFLCFQIVGTAARRARNQPELEFVGHMAFTLRLALIAFTVTAIFASNAYTYYFPILAGVCVAFERAVTAQLAPLTVTQPPSQPRYPVRAQARASQTGSAIAWKNAPSR
jgi:hypothetical protein